MSKTIEVLFCILCVSIFLFIIPTLVKEKTFNYEKAEYADYLMDELAWKIESHTVTGDPRNVTSYFVGFNPPDNISFSLYDDNFTLITTDIEDICETRYNEGDVLYLYDGNYPIAYGAYSYNDSVQMLFNFTPFRYIIMEDKTTHKKKGICLADHFVVPLP